MCCKLNLGHIYKAEFVYCSLGTQPSSCSKTEKTLEIYRISLAATGLVLIVGVVFALMVGVAGRAEGHPAAIADTVGCEEAKNYLAQPNRTIRATVITQYHVKTVISHPPYVVSGAVAYSGTFELPWEERVCVGCWRWPRKVWYEIPRTKKQFVKRYIESTSARLTVETKKITGLKDNLYCNVTLWTGTCMNDLTDGAIIIRHRWEADSRKEDVAEMFNGYEYGLWLTNFKTRVREFEDKNPNFKGDL